MIPEWLLIWGSALSGGLVILFGYRQFRLHQLEITKARAEAEAQKKADLGANFYSLGTKQTRLKIFNRGPSTARNVRLTFLESDDCFFSDEIADKFPMEALAVHGSVELRVVRSLDMRRVKYPLKLVWDDDFKKDNEITAYPTL